MTEESRLASLRDEIAQMLAAALATDHRHTAELQRLDEQHIAESRRRDELHLQELQRRAELHAHEVEIVREALETRDLIGQAKGVIMVALSCSPDEAFQLLRKQSQHENRKLVEVAADVARRGASRSSGTYHAPGAG